MSVIRQAVIRACVRQSAARASLRVLFVTAVCAGLLSPFIGVLLDHHFAERYGSHVHVYFGASHQKHTHLYERAHSDTNVGQTSAVVQGRAVAVISEDSGSPNVNIALGLSGTEGDKFGPAREATTLWRVAPGDTFALTGRDVPPLDQPPRA
ncbi:MAG: hypothetical protein EXR57_00430 [Dehalococcoidia bacterium]|nr:hypothetical protein [Dehalococcoidia bacterium]MSQ34270.1 hypothetical protein [Dehalococcoidia bacterium]